VRRTGCVECDDARGVVGWVLVAALVWTVVVELTSRTSAHSWNSMDHHHTVNGPVPAPADLTAFLTSDIGRQPQIKPAC
jgi:uncharacterized PurR-regulated membrane protein YhhQ (DUF165 family)